MDAQHTGRGGTERGNRAVPRPTLAAPLEPLPPRFAAVLRPELPSLGDEILAEICRGVPELAPAIRGEHAVAVRDTIDHAMRAFVDNIAAPPAATYARDEMCRALGRLQVGFDAGLTHLEAAFRIGVRVFWRRTIAVGRRYDIPMAVQSSVADQLFGYVDDLTALARVGYLDARRGTSDAVSRYRRRLARELLDGRAGPSVLAQHAAQAGWLLPETIVVVAVDSAAQINDDELDRDVLAAQSRGRTVLLLPGVPDRARIARLRAAIGSACVAVGPAVGPAGLRDAVRWAVRALALAERGAIDVADDGVVLAAEHLLAVWLSADVALARTVCATNLAALEPMAPQQRERMIETLYWWLVHNGNAAQMGDALGIHPQTVRYRMRTLDGAVGDRLDDPEWRISTELALRALRAAGAWNPASVADDVRVS